ncbi:extracellular lipase [Apiospora arundinis]
MKTYSLIYNSLLAVGVLAEPTAEQLGSPTVVIPAPDATIVGVPVGVVEIFHGIPFAKPPVQQLRFNAPQPLDPSQSLGTIKALTVGAACPQNLQPDIPTTLPSAVRDALQKLRGQLPVASVFNEDCLYLNVFRPAGIDASAKLPVLFWMHGGGYEMGFTMQGEGVPMVTDSIGQGKPIIFVAATYRTNGFGFLGGKAVQDAGVANLGLLDQRQAMKWVADNIAAFGGDPDKVTIWGESAGAISVFNHLVLYDGDNTYNGKPLFRGGIMNSGSLVPADPVDCEKAQKVYDQIVDQAGCSGTQDTLQCLRDVDYKTLFNAIATLPTFTGYQSIALRFMPRPDGKTMTMSPEKLIQEGKFTKVPVIIGDEEDEGTLWSLMQANLTTKDDVADYLKTYFFHHATEQDMDEYVGTYRSISEHGSPYRTGLLNNWYPQFKRLAAILGDLAFTLSRRYFLEGRRAAAPELKAWSYLSSYGFGTPILGSVHGGDIFHIVWGVPYDYATRTIHGYYFSFVHHLDPNTENSSPRWPEYFESRKLLNMHSALQTLVSDDFRADSYAWIASHIPQLTM